MYVKYLQYVNVGCMEIQWWPSIYRKLENAKYNISEPTEPDLFVYLFLIMLHKKRINLHCTAH